MTIPPDTLQKMEGIAKTDRERLLVFWRELTQLERHEDSLINNRLQAFLVTTAFLVGAFSQFRDTNGIAPFMRVFIAAFGIVFALIMRHVLQRTAVAIEWYLERLIALDRLLFDEGIRPYETRRKEKQVQPRVPVSRILDRSGPVGPRLALQSISLCRHASQKAVWIRGEAAGSECKRKGHQHFC